MHKLFTQSTALATYQWSLEYCGYDYEGHCYLSWKWICMYSNKTASQLLNSWSYRIVMSCNKPSFKGYWIDHDNLTLTLKQKKNWSN